VHWLGGAAAGSINWLGTDIRGGYKANIAGTTTLSGAVVYAPANAGHISGLTLSAAGSSATFGIAAGAATSDDGSTPLLFPSAFTKTTAGFSFGTAGGALDTGVIAINTWYHAFIFQTATGATDIAVSTSTAPALLASSKKRRIGAMKTDGAGQWVKFFQTGNDFVWDIPVGDVSATNPGTSAVLRTLSVPLGIKTRARITVTVDASAGQVNDPGSVYISDPAVSDGAASINNRISLSNYSATDGQVVGASMECWTNTSSQVRTRLQLSGAATILAISTIGWHDLRGTL
jgi:hypothetical protein